jgi:hypothetical protein
MRVERSVVNTAIGMYWNTSRIKILAARGSEVKFNGININKINKNCMKKQFCGKIIIDYQRSVKKNKI